MAKVVVAYHSGFGHTKVIAEHVAKGVASVAGVSCEIINVEELPAPGPDRSLGGQWATLNAADGIIFGSPTYMGNVSAKFKQFMDHSGGIWFGQGWKNKLAAGFTNSGSMSGDKLNTLGSLAYFAGQHSMIWVSQGVMPSAYTGDGKNLNRLGAWIGMMSQSDNGPPDQTPPKEDRETAEVFGRRFGEIAARWTKAG